MLGCCYSVLERGAREIIKWKHGTYMILAKALRDRGWTNLQTCTRKHTLPFNTRMSVGTYLRNEKCSEKSGMFPNFEVICLFIFNTLRTGDADLRFYITTVQDGWFKSAFLTRACFPCTIHIIMQYIEPVSEWSCWRMLIETWPHSELTFRHCASSIYRCFATLQRTLFVYLMNKYISFSEICLTVHHWYK